MGLKNNIQKAINDIPDERIKEAENKLVEWAKQALAYGAVQAVNYLKDKKFITKVLSKWKKG